MAGEMATWQSCVLSDTLGPIWGFMRLKVQESL